MSKRKTMHRIARPLGSALTWACLISVCFADLAAAQDQEVRSRCGQCTIIYSFDSQAGTLTREVGGCNPEEYCWEIPGYVQKICQSSHHSAVEPEIDEVEKLSGQAKICACENSQCTERCSTCQVAYLEPVGPEESEENASFEGSLDDLTYATEWDGSRIVYTLANYGDSTIRVTWRASPFISETLTPGSTMHREVAADSVRAELATISYVEVDMDAGRTASTESHLLVPTDASERSY